MLKDRENQPYKGFIMGTVINPFPEIKIALNDKIMLEKDKLIFASHLISEKSTENIDKSMTISGDLSGGNDDASTAIGSLTFYDGTTTGNKETIMDININKGTSYTAYYDLMVGDEVILIPSQDEQIYFVADKGVRL